MSLRKLTRDLLALSAYRRRGIRATLLRLTGGSGRSFVLLYHRVGDRDRNRSEVVPTLPVPVFRRQLDLLGELGEVVALSSLLDRLAERPQRPRFAITLDDDYPEHVEHVLPALEELGVRATFFLSGRSLHGLGPYWWELLERAIAARGLDAVCSHLDVRAESPAHLAALIQDNPPVERLTGLAKGSTPAAGAAAGGRPHGLDAGSIRTLANAGMEIGFHTLHHPVLTELERSEAAAALEDGRNELQEAAGVPVELFAYPHGVASPALAELARRSGFRAAFGGGGRPIGRHSDRFLLGRWEPGPMVGEEFVAALALRLSCRPAAAWR